MSLITNVRIWPDGEWYDEQDDQPDYKSDDYIQCTVTLDGDALCVLYGDNLQDGVAGFGYELEEAVDDFITNFTNEYGCL